jgi:hypothetical protein
MKSESENPEESTSNFRLSWNRGDSSPLHAGMSSMLVIVSQRIRLRGTPGMRQSLLVEGRAEADGTLVVRIIVTNPDWDERLQIACIRSRPDDPDCLTAMGTNLDHIPL